MIEVITGLVSGLFTTLIGYLIKFHGWTSLVAGYDQFFSSVPEEAVAEIAGGTTLRIGVAILVLVCLGFFFIIPDYVYIIFAFGMLLAVGRLLYRLNTY